MENEIKPKTVIGLSIAGLVVVLALMAIFQGADFFLYKAFAPKYEQVRRETFEQTRSFNQGMVQELENMQVDYLKSKDATAKAALASVILHRASGYNLNDPVVPYTLRTFVDELKRDHGLAR